MMAQETNPHLKAAILEVVENQLRDDTLPEARETYDRLVANGYTDQEARELIGAVLTTEIFDVLKNQESFDQTRYVNALHKLPKLP